MRRRKHEREPVHRPGTGAGMKVSATSYLDPYCVEQLSDLASLSGTDECGLALDVYGGGSIVAVARDMSLNDC